MQDRVRCSEYKMSAILEKRRGHYIYINAALDGAALDGATRLQVYDVSNTRLRLSCVNSVFFFACFCMEKLQGTFNCSKPTKIYC